jgi:CDP-diacylglycerol--serine O-phosphatidyltransferase
VRIAKDTVEKPLKGSRRERVLKRVSVLPSLATLGNLVCGLGAIYMCMLSMHAGGADLNQMTLNSTKMESLFPTYLAIAAYLLVGAMFFDGLDGRLARLTRKTSEFGGQLDSLADIVSFGIAPVVLVLCVAHPSDVHALSAVGRIYWRTEWVMAASYACCAALRLARFNVENVADESAHMGFRGLPSPGAAAAVVGLVIFHEELLREYPPSWASAIVSNILPPFALILGLLMVSRVRYLHMVNALLRGRKPFQQVVTLALLLLVGLIVQPQLTIALVAVAYAMSGPILTIRERLVHIRGQAVADAGVDASGSPTGELPESPEDHRTDSARPAV